MLQGVGAHDSGASGTGVHAIGGFCTVETLVWMAPSASQDGQKKLWGAVILLDSHNYSTVSRA